MTRRTFKKKVQYLKFKINEHEKLNGTDPELLKKANKARWSRPDFEKFESYSEVWKSLYDALNAVYNL